jgi:hypothetical protein
MYGPTTLPCAQRIRSALKLLARVDPTDASASLPARVGVVGSNEAIPEQSTSDVGPTRASPLQGRTAVRLLTWETTHLSAFAFSAQAGVSLDVGQLIGLTIANVVIAVYLGVVVCTGAGEAPPIM